ncbi:hypothetical protein [Cytobacillus praedii]|uniref:hypothetical protein n=1 Tax=Cytobacillus praedii TaxID=1742358 RepID=UPI002E2305E9|nr:hypothetical protein [Cytobacillus praedii]
MEQLKLFTCEDGIKRMNDKEKFWAWVDDSFAKGGFGIEVNKAEAILEDEGLFEIKRLASVEIISTP